MGVNTITILLAIRQITNYHTILQIDKAGDNKVLLSDSYQVNLTAS